MIPLTYPDIICINTESKGTGNLRKDERDERSENMGRRGSDPNL